MHSKYKEFLETGDYPYLNAVVDFIKKDLSRELSIDEADRLKSWVYNSSQKISADKEKAYIQEMKDKGYDVLTRERAVELAKQTGKQFEIIIEGEGMLGNKIKKDAQKYNIKIDKNGTPYIHTNRQTRSGFAVPHFSDDKKMFIKIEQTKSESVKEKPIGENQSVTSNTEIQDFGEKLGGAKKDYYNSLSEAKNLDIEKEPLSKTFPLPDYQKLLDNGIDPKIAPVRVMRDEIPPKPRQSYRLGRYKSAVELFRNFSEELLSGKMSAENVFKALEESKKLEGIRNIVDLYLKVGHDNSLKDIRFERNHWSLYKGEKDVTIWQIFGKGKKTAYSNMPRMLAVVS